MSALPSPAPPLSQAEIELRIWDRAIAMTLHVLREGAEDRGQALRDLADDLDRERDGAFVRVESERAAARSAQPDGARS